LDAGLKSRRSSSDSTSPKIRPKPPQIPLIKQDYPNVKHWERRRNDPIQFTAINVYDAELSDADLDSGDCDGITKQECGILAFLEEEDGKIISRCERKRLYAELRGFWNDNINASHPPDNWSSAGATLRDNFRDTLEQRFPFLRLCAGRWKVEALWKKNYHSWKRSLLARQAKKISLDSGISDVGNYANKRKRKDSKEHSEPLASNGEIEMLLLDVPQPKKVKTQMGQTISSSISTTSHGTCTTEVRDFIQVVDIFDIASVLAPRIYFSALNATQKRNT
jgi:hypothetical protein